MATYGVTFPDLDIIRADMVHTHGVTPSVCVCLAVLKEQRNARGDLIFTEDGAKLFSFRDCVIRSLASRSGDSMGGVHAEVEIVDRRWKWKYRRVSGRYNLRTQLGKPLTASIHKTWAELFSIVLEALGEKLGAYTVKVPPAEVDAPSVDWDDVRADIALEELAEKAGCIVSLMNDDTVLISPIGKPAQRLSTDDATVPTIKFLSPEMPSHITVRFAPTVYQSTMLCDCVVYEIDGRLVPIHLASWIQDWDKFRKLIMPGMLGGVRTPYDASIYNDNLNAGYADLGIKTDSASQRAWYSSAFILGRLFKITAHVWWESIGVDTLISGQKYETIDDLVFLPNVPFITGYKIADDDGWIDVTHGGSIDQLSQRDAVSSVRLHVYSFDDYANSTWIANYPIYGAGHHSDYPPGLGATGGAAWHFPYYGTSYGVGSWWVRNETLTENNFIFTPESGTFLTDKVYMGLDQEGYFTPAVATAGVSFTVRSNETGRPHRLEHSEATRNSNSDDGKHVIDYSDIGCAWVERIWWGCGTEVRENLSVTNKQLLIEDVAPSIIAGYKRRFTKSFATGTSEWHGLKNVNVSGEIQQVRWFIDSNKVFTQASLNCEYPVYARQHKERRLGEEAANDYI